ncbi:Kelch repeat-containing protein [Patulibacter defluvii]|uniref:Kelch repeat-containing protein n=1 Tax=Patulibacter defluvii TaxID=3095358 RepID=UPI002A75BDF7|nr:hypothetical protein [Patulibacter sp. DM4]
MLAVPAAADAAAGWDPVASDPVAEQASTATLQPDGTVLVVARMPATEDQPAATRAVRYDPDRNAWADAGTLALESVDAALPLPDGRTLVLGVGSGDRVNRGWRPRIFDPTDGSWTTGTDLEVSGAPAVTALLPDGRVLAIGRDRATDRGRNTGTWIYEPKSGRWSAAVPFPDLVPETATTTGDGRVLALGSGLAPDGATARSFVYRDEGPGSDGLWSPAGPVGLGTPLLASARTLDGSVLMVLGRTATFRANVWRFDPPTTSWSTTGGVDTVPGALGVLMANDRMLLLADEARVRDPLSGLWSAEPPLTSARRGGQVTVLRDARILFTGPATAGDAAAPVALLDPGPIGGRPDPPPPPDETPDDPPPPPPADPPPPPAPEPGVQAAADATAGKVEVKVPGATEFKPLDPQTAVPVGSEVDARAGAVTLRLRATRPFRATVRAGRFVLAQGRKPPYTTELRLVGSGCRSTAPTKDPRAPLPGGARSTLRAALRTAVATLQKKKPPKTRKTARKTKRPRVLRVRRSGNGGLRTRTNDAVATARGTDWTTTEGCDGTSYKVHRGSIVVRDLRTKRSRTVRTGKTLRVAARGRR